MVEIEIGTATVLAASEKVWNPGGSTSSGWADSRGEYDYLLDDEEDW